MSQEEFSVKNENGEYKDYVNMPAALDTLSRYYWTVKLLKLDTFVAQI